jgi:hypothetical protein
LFIVGPAPPKSRAGEGMAGRERRRKSSSENDFYFYIAIKFLLATWIRVLYISIQKDTEALLPI